MQRSLKYNTLTWNEWRNAFKCLKLGSEVSTSRQQVKVQQVL